jgi:hypothetical protein
MKGTGSVGEPADVIGVTGVIDAFGAVGVFVAAPPSDKPARPPRL